MLTPLFGVVLDVLERAVVQRKHYTTKVSLPTLCAATKFFVSILEVATHFRGFAATRLRSYLHIDESDDKILPDVRLGNFSGIVRICLEL